MDWFGTVLGVLNATLLIYWVRRAMKLERRLNEAHQRLFDETVNRMNGEDID